MSRSRVSHACPRLTQFVGRSTCYVIQAHGGGAIKVGHAKDIAKRIAILQTGNPSELVVRALVAGGPKAERYLHERLDTWRVVGEWFHPDCIEKVRGVLVAHPDLIWCHAKWPTKGHPPIKPKRVRGPSIEAIQAKMRETLLEVVGEQDTVRLLAQAVLDAQHEDHVKAASMFRTIFRNSRQPIDSIVS